MTTEGQLVRLYVYDLSNGLAAQLSPMLLGRRIEAIYHTAIVVGGIEYYFGGGIQQVRAGCTQYGRPIQIIDLGRTEIPAEVRQEYLADISGRYSAATYNLFTHNCNNFSDEFATFLLGSGIPSHITSLPADVLATPFGQSLAPMLTGMEAQLATPEQQAVMAQQPASVPAADPFAAVHAAAATPAANIAPAAAAAAAAAARAAVPVQSTAAAVSVPQTPAHAAPPLPQTPQTPVKPAAPAAAAAAAASGSPRVAEAAAADRAEALSGALGQKAQIAGLRSSTDGQVPAQAAAAASAAAAVSGEPAGPHDITSVITAAAADIADSAEAAAARAESAPVGVQSGSGAAQLVSSPSATATASALKAAFQAALMEEFTRIRDTGVSANEAAILALKALHERRPELAAQA